MIGRKKCPQRATGGCGTGLVEGVAGSGQEGVSGPSELLARSARWASNKAVLGIETRLPGRGVEPELIELGQLRGSVGIVAALDVASKSSTRLL